ncbi:MAG TPA: serine/threonine-protein kinase [Kofleriaceae bacterium]|nr:serine/threonine-protein kinase [Kofleriaceae bacterium]
MIEFTPGAIVGRYEIVRRLGAGGMAEVYVARARNDPGAAPVAIKRLLPAFAHEPRLNEMFVAEARLAATLHHPNIAEVFDVGLDHDVCFFAMELVDGHDVRTLLAAAAERRRPMPLAISISVMYGTTCALAYVHDPNGPHAQLNLVHRDISPSNILVSNRGAIKLVDFGIARVETGASPRTSSGGLKGKIPYMSPEQCRARPLDGRSDLFSLGVVLYELTTGRRPFDRASEFETLEAIVRGELVAPSRLVKGYPRDLEDIVLRLLATRPADRYPSAGALLVDLDRVVAAHGLDLSSAALAAHIDELLGRGAAEVPKAPAPAKPRETPVHRPPPREARLATLPGGMALDDLRLAAAGLHPAARAPNDRIVAKCDALLERIAPGTTDARDLPASAVAQLFGHVMRYHARGDLEAAVLALELALSAARTDSDIDALLASNDELIHTVHHAFLGPQSRTIALSHQVEQLVDLAIDQRAIYLMTRIEGVLTVRELLATCGLPRREACRHLCQLLLRELIVLV